MLAADDSLCDVVYSATCVRAIGRSISLPVGYFSPTSRRLTVSGAPIDQAYTPRSGAVPVAVWRALGSLLIPTADDAGRKPSWPRGLGSLQHLTASVGVAITEPRHPPRDPLRFDTHIFADPAVFADNRG